MGQMSLVGVGHSRSDSIVPLMLPTVCCAMAGAVALYYRTTFLSSINKDYEVLVKDAEDLSEDTS